MKINIYLFLIIFLFNSYLNAQNKIFGKWYGTDVKNLDNSDMYINDLEYSTLTTFDFKKDKVNIEGFQDFNFSIDNQNLKIGNRNFQYTLRNDSLILVSNADRRIYYLISRNAFVKQFKKIFEDDFEIIDGDTIYNKSELTEVYFRNDDNFHQYLIDRIPSYQNYSSTNNSFISSFVLSPNGEIKDLKIEGNENTKFYKQLKEAILGSQKFWVNNSNQNVRIKDNFHFTNGMNPNTNEEIKSFLKIRKDGLQEYNKNNFEKAIEILEPISHTTSNDIFIKGNLLEVKKKLAISYLAVGQTDKACSIFKSFEKKNYFESRNYIKNFCSP